MNIYIISAVTNSKLLGRLLSIELCIFTYKMFQYTAFILINDLLKWYLQTNLTITDKNKLTNGNKILKLNKLFKKKYFFKKPPIKKHINKLLNCTDFVKHILYDTLIFKYDENELLKSHLCHVYKEKTTKYA